MKDRRLTIAFWNVLDLFPPGANDRAPQSHDEVLAKLDRIAQVLRGLGPRGSAPALIGLAEVAAEGLVKRIARAIHPDDPGRMGWVWAPSPDASHHTGLTLLYDRRTVMDVAGVDVQRADPRSRPHVLWVECSIAKACAPLHVAVAHWKSRRFDEGSNGWMKRAQSGEWIAGKAATLPRDAAIVVVGDLNDEPFDRAVQGSMLARRTHAGVLGQGAKGRFFNASWAWLAEPHAYVEVSRPGFVPRRPDATHDHRSARVLDQLLVSAALLRREVFGLDEGSVRIHADPIASFVAPHGRLVPERWAWDAGARRGTGASDHFPIAADVVY